VLAVGYFLNELAVAWVRFCPTFLCKMSVYDPLTSLERRQSHRFRCPCCTDNFVKVDLEDGGIGMNHCCSPSAAAIEARMCDHCDSLVQTKGLVAIDFKLAKSKL